MIKMILGKIYLIQLMDSQVYSADFGEHKEFASLLITRPFSVDDKNAILDIVEDIKTTIEEWDYDIIYESILDYFTRQGVVIEHDREMVEVL